MLVTLKSDFAIRYLKAIEKKHKDYFTTNSLEIMNCVKIVGSNIVSVHITNTTLPFEIRYDIESLFWR